MPAGSISFSVPRLVAVLLQELSLTNERCCREVATLLANVSICTEAGERRSSLREHLSRNPRSLKLADCL